MSNPNPVPDSSANNQLANVDDTSSQRTLTVAQVSKCRAAVIDLMRSVMVDGLHFGKIKGCGDKPTLLQPGAQMVLQLFNCSPRFQITATEMPGYHRMVSVACQVVHNGTGRVVGEGRGLCSTMEDRYRWRKGGRVCPDCGAAAIKVSQFERGGYYCHEKVGGCGAKFERGDRRIEDQQVGRVENDNPFDVYNTVEKMGCKRALVHAALNLSGASDVFTQDVEDLVSPDDAIMEPDAGGTTAARPAPAPSTPAAKSRTVVNKADQAASTSAPAPAPARASGPAPERAKITSAGTGEALVIEVKKIKSSPEGSRNPWDLYRVVLERDGRQTEVTTLSQHVADNALLAMTHRKPAKCRWSFDGKYANLDECEPIGVPTPKGRTGN